MFLLTASILVLYAYQFSRYAQRTSLKTLDLPLERIWCLKVSDRNLPSPPVMIKYFKLFVTSEIIR